MSFCRVNGCIECIASYEDTQLLPLITWQQLVCLLVLLTFPSSNLCLIWSFNFSERKLLCQARLYEWGTFPASQSSADWSIYHNVRSDFQHVSGPSRCYTFRDASTTIAGTIAAWARRGRSQLQGSPQTFAKLWNFDAHVHRQPSKKKSNLHMFMIDLLKCSVEPQEHSNQLGDAHHILCTG